MASFAKTIGKWAAKTKRRTNAVYARSLEGLETEMSKTVREGGRVPFQYGNLANSLLASKSGMPPMSDTPSSGSNVGLIAATIQAHETVFFGYTARYARRMNSGFVGADSRGRVYNQQGHYFVEHAIASWPNIVKNAVVEIKAGL